jgi:hypothetical protein
MGEAPQEIRAEGVTMEYVVLIEREPGASTVGAYSPDVNVTVVRDASVSDGDLLAAFKDALDFHIQALKDDGLPLPKPHHRVAMVST